MKKEKSLKKVVIFSLICIFLISFVSAGWFSGLFSKITGHAVYSDGFGFSLDSNKWKQIEEGNPAIVENQKLKAVGSAGEMSSSVSGITSSDKWILKGDFEVQVSYDSTIQPISDSSATTVISVAGDSYFYNIANAKNNNGGYWTYAWTSQGAKMWTNGAGFSSLSSGKWRIKRVSNVMSGYQFQDGSWVKFAEISGCDTTDMTVELKVFNNIGSVTGKSPKVPQAYFDDFFVNSGKVIILNCEPKTCTELQKTCGMWDDSCGGVVDCGECDEITCTDTDGGLDYIVFGSAYLTNGNLLNDNCADDYALRERYCENDIIKSKIKMCPNGCFNGVCIINVHEAKTRKGTLIFPGIYPEAPTLLDAIKIINEYSDKYSYNINGHEGCCRYQRLDNGQVVDNFHSKGYLLMTHVGSSKDVIEAANDGIDIIMMDEIKAERYENLNGAGFNSLKAKVKAINPDAKLGIVEPYVSQYNSWYNEGAKPDVIGLEQYIGSVGKFPTYSTFKRDVISKFPDADVQVWISNPSQLKSFVGVVDQIILFGADRDKNNPFGFPLYSLDAYESEIANLYKDSSSGYVLRDYSAPGYVNIGESFEIRCDYGEVLPCVVPVHGNVSCDHLRFEGTTGVFNCTATESGEVENYCTIFSYAKDERCSVPQKDNIDSTYVIMKVGGCYYDEDCEDDEKCIDGKCILGGCFFDSDCGESGYTGEFYCDKSKESLVGDYVEYTCNGPGTQNSYCSNKTFVKIEQECSGEEMCLNGECREPQECSDCGLFWGVGCTENSCHNLGDCYYTPGVLTVASGCEEMTTFCEINPDCSDINEAECENDVCGLNCEVRAGECIQECVPNCDARECGNDSCGGSCGECGVGEECNDLTGICQNITLICTSFTYSDWGECTLGNIQTRDVLSSLPEGCVGGNPNLTRECNYIPPECTEDIECSDGNICTTDLCVDEKCISGFNNVLCDDNNPCTEDDFCFQGGCFGSPVYCDDENNCTTDSCVNGECQYVFANSEECTCEESLDCVDNNVCTTEACINNKCVYVNNLNNCTDNNPCTDDDKCRGGDCIGTSLGCDDGDFCTVDGCVNGECEHVFSNLVFGCECFYDEECIDNNVCTDDSCFNHICVFTSNENSCTDNNPCTEDDQCREGKCVGTSLGCDDGDFCTVDGCVNGECEHVFSDLISGCECFYDEECVDNNVCTNDSCFNHICVFTPNENFCDDNNPCTLNDKCIERYCIGTSLGCDDGDFCTIDRCSNGACIYEFVKNSTCGCTNNYDCYDNNICTTDSCVNYTCVNSYNTFDCDDNDVCTTDDQCREGECIGEEIDCDDDNLCTVDSCVYGTCHHLFSSFIEDCGCEDDDYCDSDNPCVEDYCDLDTNTCEVTYNDGDDCDDGNSNTDDDTCDEGDCIGITTYSTSDDDDDDEESSSSQSLGSSSTISYGNNEENSDSSAVRESMPSNSPDDDEPVSENKKESEDSGFFSTTAIIIIISLIAGIFFVLFIIFWYIRR